MKADATAREPWQWDSGLAAGGDVGKERSEVRLTRGLGGVQTLWRKARPIAKPSAVKAVPRRWGSILGGGQ